MILNKNQIEIADFLLKYLDSVGGSSSLDDYPEKLNEQGFGLFEWKALRQILIEQLDLICFVGNNNYNIMLTPDGNKASKIGIEKYLFEIENDKQLDREAKKANIDGVKKANKNAKRAIIIAIIVPLLILVIQIYFDNRKNSITNGNNDGGVRPEINHSQFPLDRADTLFIEELKNLLKHDTVFLNEIKNK